jgi:hypothetical protein
MPPLAQVEDLVGEVESLDEARPPTRWTVGADVGVGAGAQREILGGLYLGFRHGPAFAAVRVDGVLDDRSLSLEGCYAPAGWCPTVSMSTRARGALLVGGSVGLRRGSALDVAAGPSWQIRATRYAEDSGTELGRWTALHAGAGAEVGLRVPAGAVGFGRLALGVWTYEPVEREVVDSTSGREVTVYPGLSPVTLRFGFTL